MTERARILVVDDDQVITKTLVDILSSKGYRAASSNNGFDALEILKQDQYNLLVSDIRMPEMNGIELFRAATRIRQEMAVILMTAYATDELVREGLQEGVIVVMNKPLDINNLLRHISYVLKNNYQSH